MKLSNLKICWQQGAKELSPYNYPTLTWDSGVFISLIQTKISQKSGIPFNIYCESDTNKYASLMNRDIIFISV